MNERASRAGPQRAPPSGLCGGLGTPTRAATWASRVRHACVHAYSRAAGGFAKERTCPRAAALPPSTQYACVRGGALRPSARAPVARPRGTRTASGRSGSGFCCGAATNLPAGLGALGAGQTPLGGGGGGWGVPLICVARSWGCAQPDVGGD